MDLDYSIFVNKSKKMLKIIKNEYNEIIENYSEDNIIRKSYPIKVKDSLNAEEKEKITLMIGSFFDPTLKTISLLIDNGLVTWDSALEEIKLDDIKNNDKNIEHLIYESWEKMYVYKHIRYNLIMNFLIQIYLYVEKELSIFLYQKYKEKNLNTLFSCINIIEEDGRKIDINIKKKINMYRNIINVHKHGKGTSLEELKKNNLNILNSCLNSNDLSFLFNLKLVSFEKLYEVMNKFLDELY